jgi:hypothetical protein
LPSLQLRQESLTVVSFFLNILFLIWQINSAFIFSAFEKLILPFDLGTWIWTLVTFATAFLTILIVYRMKAENLVFGDNVTTPSLNVLAAFFGLSQIVMPKRNFARFLVMAFILLSFMIRNLYQGAMCDFLQRDMRGPEQIQSVEDVNNKDFQLFFDDSFNFWENIEYFNSIFSTFYK